MRTIHTLFSLVVTSLVVACIGNDPTLLPEGGQLAAASQFHVSLEELNEELPNESPKWDQFFYERGALALWQQLHSSNNAMNIVLLHLDRLQLDQEAISDAVGAGIIRYLAYYHKDQVNVIRFIGGLSPGKKLTSLDPAIGELKNLQELWLTDNQLQALPERFGELENLQELWLAKNQLQALPDNIRGLKSLQDIYLSANQLTCLSERLLPWFQQVSYKNTIQNPWLKPDDLSLVDRSSLVAKAKEAQQSSL
ncbi:MAG: leucine-rich repeat domain-containing protein, partial [Bacteroidota bacterium]